MDEEVSSTLACSGFTRVVIVVWYFNTPCTQRNSDPEKMVNSLSTPYDKRTGRASTKYLNAFHNNF